MSVSRDDYGYHNGYKCWLFTLKNESGMIVKLTNYSAAIISIIVPDKNGNYADVALGYDNLQSYVDGTSSQGAVVGRFANRIAGGKFTLNGKEYRLYQNDGTNCLHGGEFGFNKRVWTVDAMDDNSVTFGYISPDGEERFPGTVKIKVKYTLKDDNSLELTYLAKSNADTILNLTNHCYFNLKGYDGGSILDHELQIFAEKYTPVDVRLIPTGEIADVEDTAFDFREPKLIGKSVEDGLVVGYDHNFILGEPGEMRKAAVISEESTGRVMTTYTDMPAMQLYTAIGLNEMGKDCKMMKMQTAFCLETQFSPDTPNQPNFPQCVLKKGEEYRHSTIYKFSVK